MLADLSLVNCYNKTGMRPAQRDRLILQSAKDNLRDMAFFGLTEFQQDMQMMFENTFNLRFTRDFDQYNQTHAKKADISPKQHQHIIELNKLDIELYQYAKDLFFQRLKTMRDSDRFRTKTMNAEQRYIRDSNDELEENYVEDEDS